MAIGLCVLRIVANASREIGDGRIVVLPAKMDPTAIREGEERLRGEGDGAVEIRERLFRIALLHPRDSSMNCGPSIPRFRFDYLRQRGDCLVEFALTEQCSATFDLEI